MDEHFTGLMLQGDSGKEVVLADFVFLVLQISVKH
jgi:hypothetical protein